MRNGELGMGNGDLGMRNEPPCPADIPPMNRGRVDNELRINN